MAIMLFQSTLLTPWSLLEIFTMDKVVKKFAVFM